MKLTDSQLSCIKELDSLLTENSLERLYGMSWESDGIIYKNVSITWRDLFFKKSKKYLSFFDFYKRNKKIFNYLKQTDFEQFSQIVRRPLDNLFSFSSFYNLNISRVKDISILDTEFEDEFDKQPFWWTNYFEYEISQKNQKCKKIKIKNLKL